MKISEFIVQLEQIKRDHGNLEVETRSADGSRREHKGPEIAYRQNLIGREWKPAFCCDINDLMRKGDKVCRV